MPLLVDSTKARTRLEYLTQANVDPVLEEGELQDLLDDHKAVAVWSAGASFEFGAKVVPTANNRNGCIYKVVAFDGSGRSTGATEPSWSTSRGSRVSDGNITWEECDSEPVSLWDLDKAAEAGWLIKAGKVAHEHDYGDADHKMSASQMYDHCIEQASKFRTVRVG